MFCAFFCLLKREISFGELGQKVKFIQKWLTTNIFKTLYECIFLKFNFIIMRVVWYIHVFYDRNFFSNSKYVFVDPGNQFIWFMIKKSIKIVILYRLFNLYNFNPIAIFYLYRVFQNVETKVFYHLIWPGVTKKKTTFSSI